MDYGQVVAMADIGIPRRVIAARLGCSYRTVRRILHKQGIGSYKPNPLIDTADESALWAEWLVFESAEQVARRFGRSRQTIGAADVRRIPTTEYKISVARGGA